MKEIGKEILVLNLEEKKHRAEKVQFEQIRKIWEEQVTCVSKNLENIENLMKWTHPLRGEFKHVRRMNSHLESKNGSLKDKVEDLQEQLDLIQMELEKKGLKMTVVEETISQLIVNKEEIPKE